MINIIDTSVKDRYALGWFDRMTPRNPIAKWCAVILNSVERDHYGDARVIEESRILKPCKFEKDEQQFVQFFDSDELLEDMGEPFVCTMSITDLPRQPKTDDRIIVDGMLYSVSVVKPINREMHSIMKLLCYPERDQVDRLRDQYGELIPWVVVVTKIDGGTEVVVTDNLVIGEQYVARITPRGSMVSLHIGERTIPNSTPVFRFTYTGEGMLYAMATDSDGYVDGEKTTIRINLI